MPSPAASASPVSSLVRQELEDVDDAGNRLIRHLGQGVYLTSRVDPRGRLLRQELLLGPDFVVWQHGTRIRTGLCARPDRPAEAVYDVNPSRTRLERARLAAAAYVGKDKYIKHLARVLSLAASAGMPGAEVVTVSEDEQRLRRQRGSETRRPTWALVLGAAAAVLLLAWLLLRH